MQATLSAHSVSKLQIGAGLVQVRRLRLRAGLMQVRGLQNGAGPMQATDMAEAGDLKISMEGSV